MLLYHQLLKVARRATSHPAFLHLGKTVTYAELLPKVARLSYLYQAELGPKARVAILPSPSPALVTSFLALTNTRTPVLLLDPSLGIEEQARTLQQLQITHLGVGADLVTQARELLRVSRLSIPLIEIERKKGGEYDETFSPPPENPPKETDATLLLCTAGTSGEPKWATFDHKQLLLAVTSLQGLYRFKPGDRITTPLNGSHPFAWMHGMLLPALTGTTCVIDLGLSGIEYARFLIESRVTRLLMDARSAQELLTVCVAQGLRIPSLSALVIGPGAGVTALAGIRELARSLEIPVASAYGQTETGWAAAIEDPASSEEGLRGLSPLKFKVLDENGDEIPRPKGGASGKRVGHLAISNGAIMGGYRGANKEETENATRQAIRGTWYYTGDFAELSGDGESLRLRILGRRGELLVAPVSEGPSREPISPEPIDAVARAVPGVLDAAGFVVKDARGRSRLACAVVREEGFALREALVFEHCRKNLAAGHAPDCVVFTDFIPRGKIGGAVNRLRLARQFQGISPEDPSPTPTPIATEDSELNKGPPVVDVKYSTCDLAEIPVNLPLPVTLYAYYKATYVPFRPKGTQIDRDTYDKLELKQHRQLYILAEDAGTLRAWKMAQERLAGASAGPDSDLTAARRGAHRELLTLFASSPNDEFAARAVSVSRTLVAEVTKSGGAIKSLRELQAFSRGTIEHSVNVSILATYFALHLGYEHTQILQHVGLGALLHDLGRVKLAIEEDEALESATERTEKHPLAGADALAAEESIPREVKMIVAQHHECFDGTGYPGKIKGARIYELARIVAIADVLDNLLSRATGDLRTRWDWAFYKLETEYSGKLDPFKVEKALRLLQLGRS